MHVLQNIIPLLLITIHLIKGTKKIDGQAHFKINVQVCGKKLRSDIDEINRIKLHYYPTKRSEECLLGCALKRIGLIGSRNEIVLKNVKKEYKSIQTNYPKLLNKVMKLYKECKKIEKEDSDECAAANHFAKCIYPKEQMLFVSSKTKHILNNCMNKTSTTDVDVYKILVNMFPTTKEGYCLLACYMKEMGELTKDNKIVLNEIKEKNKNLVLQNPFEYIFKIRIFEECIGEEKDNSDECAAVQAFYKCVKLKITEEVGNALED